MQEEDLHVPSRGFPQIPLEKIRVDSKHKHYKTQWSLWLSNTMGLSTLEVYTINVVWESDHNVHLARERGQFYMYTANVKQTVQSVSVDVLGSTALVGQDVYAKPSLCQNPHSARDDSPCRDCCPNRYHTRCSLHTYKWGRIAKRIWRRIYTVVLEISVLGYFCTLRNVRKLNVWNIFYTE